MTLPLLAAATTSAIATAISGRPKEIGTLTFNPGPKLGERRWPVARREG
jgi:hypothetical protein